MTVWIEWASMYRMYQISFMQGNENATIYVVEDMLPNIKFFLKRINVSAINLGSTINDEQNDTIRAAFGKGS